jgi:hypothetical protein
MAFELVSWRGISEASARGCSRTSSTQAFSPWTGSSKCRFRPKAMTKLKSLTDGNVMICRTIVLPPESRPELQGTVRAAGQRFSMTSSFRSKRSISGRKSPGTGIGPVPLRALLPDVIFRGESDLILRTRRSLD